MTKMLACAWFAASLLAFATSVMAQKTAADIPAETFFKRSQYNAMVLSPNGERLAATIPARGRDNLVVIDLKARTRKVITAFDTFDVFGIRWVNNERLCFSVADGKDVSGTFNFHGNYCINHDGAHIRDFTKLGARPDSVGGFTRIEFLALTHDGSPEVYAQMWQRSRYSADVYRFNTMNGRYQLLTLDSPGNVRQWILDRNNVPRIAVSQPQEEREGRNREVWYRENADAKWELLDKAEMLADTIAMSASIRPIAFDYDNITLYIASSQGREKSAIYKFDTKTRKKGELVWENPIIDASGAQLVFSRTEKRLLGVRWNADKPGVKWSDPEMEKLQKMVDATFSKTFNRVFLTSEGNSTGLIMISSDAQPPIYYLLDRAKPSVEKLAETREWLDPNLMAERKFVKYKARDGLEIPAWVTIPKGSEGKKLPLIVHVHGGPWVRVYGWEEWGRPDAQFWASRGYLVLQPEPRGSTGFGGKHLRLGMKQWGQTMQDDITDGAMHLVKEGLADPKRMCIYGGSYGGYASAMALAKDPDLWRCGAPYVAVTDLFLFQNLATSDISRFSDFLEGSFKRVVGDSDADKEMFEKYSPARQAHRIKAPVMLAMGSEDIRVPIDHGNALRDAIQRAGGQVEYIVYNGEAHGWNKDENVFDFYKRLEKFFEKNLKN
jgi:dipeptidyl aminopeptidase/acylaminoacyl peptidase